MSFFPDNPERKRRVEELTTQITAIQANIRTSQGNIENLEDNNQRIIKEISIRSGYSSPDQYAQAGMKYMTDAQRQTWLYICSRSAYKRDVGKYGKFTGAGIGIIGSILRMSKTVVAVACKIQCFVVCLKGIAKGLVECLTGSFEAGKAAIRLYATILKGNWTRKLAVGVGRGFDMGMKTASALKWLTRIGKLLQAVGLVAEVFFIGWDIATGIEDKERLQKLIVEASVSRFGVQKIWRLVNVTQLWLGKIGNVIAADNYWAGKIEEQKKNPPANPRLRIKAADRKEAVSKEIGVLLPQFDKDMTNITDDVVFLDVQKLDTADSWKNEDPSMQTILAEVDKNPPTDDKGNPIKLDGGDPDSVYLEWTANNVKANTPNTTITFKGLNESTSVTQKFSFMQLRFPVKPPTPEDYSEWMFESDKFGLKGTVQAVDGSVEITTDDGVVIPPNFPVSVDVDPEYYLVTVSYGTESDDEKPADANAPSLPVMEFPPGKAIYFKVTGTTGKAFEETVEATAHETRQPDTTKRWEDISINIK